MNNPTERHTTKEVAQHVGVSKETLLRWLRKGYLAEPRLRDRHGWRIWTEADVRRALAYRDRTVTLPKSALLRRPEPEEAVR